LSNDAAPGREISTGPILRVSRLRSPFAGPFDLDLEGGTCAAITGPSGSGKSLFLRMIADLDPNDGEVWLEGRERGSVPPPTWRRQVMYVAAESGWWADEVAVHFPEHRRDDVQALAARLAVAPALLSAPVLQLSTGEKQRLALVRVLAGSPRVLLLDEPTGPLDQDSVTRVEELLAERLRNGAAIVLVTHDSEQASRLGDRRYRMKAGRLEAA